MSRTFDTIASINDTKETFKIAVRILDLWLVQAHDKFKNLEMLLMDGKGDRIHAIVREEEIGSWEAKLQEGKTYYMYNFWVVRNDGQYKVCKHPFKLHFTGGTIVKQVNIPQIPLKSYEFKSFEEIVSGEFNLDFLIDVIGIVDEVKRQVPDGSPPKVVLCLKDLSGHIVNFTLSHHATKFMVWLNENDVSDCMVHLLTQSRIKPAQGAHPLTVSNSFYGSKLFINDEVLDFLIYKERLIGANLGGQSSMSLSVNMEQYSQGFQYFEWDKFFYKGSIVALSDIADVPDGLILCTFGTTSKLIAETGGWFYNSCSRCPKKAENEDISYTCSCGKFNERPIPRYRVEMVVSDKKGSGNFVFWDRDCADIVGITASELRNLMIQAHEGDPKHFPEPLDKMLGLSFAIRCKYQRKFNSYSILKLSDDAEIIKNVIQHSFVQKQSVPVESKLGAPKSPLDKDSCHGNQIETSHVQETTVIKTTVQTCSSSGFDSDHHEHKLLSESEGDRPDKDHIVKTPIKRSFSQISSECSPTVVAQSSQLCTTNMQKRINNK